MENILKSILQELKNHNAISKDLLQTQAAINCQLWCSKLNEGHDVFCWHADERVLTSNCSVFRDDE